MESASYGPYFRYRDNNEVQYIYIYMESEMKMFLKHLFKHKFEKMNGLLGELNLLYSYALILHK